MSNPSADRKKCLASRLGDSALLLSVLLMPHSLSQLGSCCSGNPLHCRNEVPTLTYRVSNDNKWLL